jgi:hypothetical protein
MMKRQMNGAIDSWAIRFCYHQFQHKLFSVHPAISKIKNIGFSWEATNTNGNEKRFYSTLDQNDNINFHFSNDVKINNKIIKQFTKPFSVKQRLKNRVFLIFLKTRNLILLSKKKIFLVAMSA